MIGFITGIAKYIIFVFNFIFLIFGSLLILFGLLPIVNGGYDSTYSKIAIAVGALIFVLSFLGCCGAVRENKNLLTAHAAILIILFIIQMVVIMVIIAEGTDYYHEIDDKLSNFIYSKYSADVNFMKDIEKWEPTEYFIFTEWKTGNRNNQVDLRNLDCCGVYNATDYTDRGIPLPGSCCGESDDVDSHNERTCTPGLAYRVGCGQKLRDYVEDNAEYVSLIFVGSAVFEIFGAIFTLWTRDHLVSSSR